MSLKFTTIGQHITCPALQTKNASFVHIQASPTLHTKQFTCQSESNAFTALSVMACPHPAHFEHVKSM